VAENAERGFGVFICRSFIGSFSCLAAASAGA
jgi:hypothetical protein